MEKPLQKLNISWFAHFLVQYQNLTIGNYAAAHRIEKSDH